MTLITLYYAPLLFAQTEGQISVSTIPSIEHLIKDDASLILPINEMFLPKHPMNIVVEQYLQNILNADRSLLNYEVSLLNPNKQAEVIDLGFIRQSPSTSKQLKDVINMAHIAEANHVSQSNDHIILDLQTPIDTAVPEPQSHFTQLTKRVATQLKVTWEPMKGY